MDAIVIMTNAGANPDSSAQPLRVALVFGGVSTEHDVSISSASLVADSLCRIAGRRPLEARAVYINTDGRFVWEPGAAALGMPDGPGPSPREAAVRSAPARA